MRSSFATDDPELAHDHVTRAYGQHRLRVGRPGEAFGYAQSRIDLGKIRLDHFHNDLPAAYTLAPTGHVMVVHITAGHVQTTTGSIQRRWQTGDIYLGVTPDAEVLTEFAPGTTVDLTSMELPLLHQVDPEHAADRVARLRPSALDQAAARSWTRSTDHLRAAVEHQGEDDNPRPGRLLLGAHGRLLAATLLELFAPEPDDAHSRDRADAHPATLRRAITHMETHPDHDLSPADLASAAGVGVRALQLAFRKHLDTTPLGYLRRVRLDRAHADLLAADPTRHTVTAIAGRWGFTDPSRFTAQYKHAYGQLPSQTLHT